MARHSVQHDAPFISACAQMHICPMAQWRKKTRFLGTDAEEARSNRDQTLPNMNPGRSPIQDHIASCIQTCRGSVAFANKSFTCVCVCVCGSFQFVKASLDLNAAFCKHRMFVCVCVFWTVAWFQFVQTSQQLNAASCKHVLFIACAMSGAKTCIVVQLQAANATTFQKAPPIGRPQIHTSAPTLTIGCIMNLGEMCR